MSVNHSDITSGYGSATPASTVSHGSFGQNQDPNKMFDMIGPGLTPGMQPNINPNMFNLQNQFGPPGQGKNNFMNQVPPNQGPMINNFGGPNQMPGPMQDGFGNQGPQTPGMGPGPGPNHAFGNHGNDFGNHGNDFGNHGNDFPNRGNEFGNHGNDFGNHGNDMYRNHGNQMDGGGFGFNEQNFNNAPNPPPLMDLDMKKNEPRRFQNDRFPNDRGHNRNSRDNRDSRDDRNYRDRHYDRSGRDRGRGNRDWRRDRHDSRYKSDRRDSRDNRNDRDSRMDRDYKNDRDSYRDRDRNRFGNRKDWNDRDRDRNDRNRDMGRGNRDYNNHERDYGHRRQGNNRERLRSENFEQNHVPPQFEVPPPLPTQTPLAPLTPMAPMEHPPVMMTPIPQPMVPPPMAPPIIPQPQPELLPPPRPTTPPRPPEPPRGDTEEEPRVQSLESRIQSLLQNVGGMGDSFGSPPSDTNEPKAKEATPPPSRREKIDSSPHMASLSQEKVTEKQSVQTPYSYTPDYSSTPNDGMTPSDRMDRKHTQNLDFRDVNHTPLVNQMNVNVYPNQMHNQESIPFANPPVDFSAVQSMKNSKEQDDDEMSISSGNSGDQNIEINPPLIANPPGLINPPNSASFMNNVGVINPWQTTGGMYGGDYGNYNFMANPNPNDMGVYNQNFYNQYNQMIQNQLNEQLKAENEAMEKKFMSVLESFVSELKDVMQNDLCKKMVQNSAFKSFDHWWMQETEYEKQQVGIRKFVSLFSNDLCIKFIKMKSSNCNILSIWSNIDGLSVCALRSVV